MKSQSRPCSQALSLAHLRFVSRRKDLIAEIKKARCEVERAQKHYDHLVNQLEEHCVGPHGPKSKKGGKK